MNLLFKRTFYPVGQGAFYAAEVYQQTPDSYQRLFRAVYDCGSITLGSQYEIRHLIYSELNKGQVDLLFISHFDRDHINCIRFLEPKTVVIPFISEEEANILNVCEDHFDYKTYQNIQDLFPNKPRIILIHPDSEEPNQELPQHLNLDIRESGSQTIELQSGSIIYFPLHKSHKRPLMEYIVFFPNLKRFFYKFKNELNEKGLDLNELQPENIKRYIRDHFDDITEVYNNLKPKNEHSLIVYSNILGRIHDFSYYRKVEDSLWNPQRPTSIYAGYEYYPTGCAYFGDITVDDKWLDKFYNILGADRIAQIGVMQVPHHGAESSHGDLILSTKVGEFKNPICVISAGRYNQFHHPSKKIVSNLTKSDAEVIVVNEHPETKLVGIGTINK